MLVSFHNLALSVIMESSRKRSVPQVHDMSWKKSAIEVQHAEPPVENINQVRKNSERTPFKDVLNTIEESRNKKGHSNSFDSVPRSRSPQYPYRREAIRKRSERKKLPGQVCDCCSAFYEALYDDGWDEKEIKDYMDRISRHRDKYPVRSRTPPGFWNPLFSDSE